MYSPIYVFGPHAQPGVPESLKSAMEETFPSCEFAVGSKTAVTGQQNTLLEVTLGANKRLSNRVYEQMVTFARGYVAGFGSRPPPPTKSDMRRYATVPSTPTAKAKSEPPTPVEVITPAKYPSGEGALRFPTHIGLAPPSQR